MHGKRPDLSGLFIMAVTQSLGIHILTAATDISICLCVWCPGVPTPWGTVHFSETEGRWWGRRVASQGEGAWDPAWHFTHSGGWADLFGKEGRWKWSLEAVSPFGKMPRDTSLTQNPLKALVVALLSQQRKKAKSTQAVHPEPPARAWAGTRTQGTYSKIHFLSTTLSCANKFVSPCYYREMQNYALCASEIACYHCK